MAVIELFHLGYDEIRKPDVHYGRKNADFGQGFYLSPDREFSVRWARERKGYSTILNCYELELEALTCKTFNRGPEWLEYIYGNRNGVEDVLSGTDVIRGPIANDTIYDTLGVTTSGFLSKENSLRLLMVGPEYIQIALKTQKAADHLKWTGSYILSSAEIRNYRETVSREEETFQTAFAEEFAKLDL